MLPKFNGKKTSEMTLRNTGLARKFRKLYKDITPLSKNFRQAHIGNNIFKSKHTTYGL